MSARTGCPFSRKVLSNMTVVSSRRQLAVWTTFSHQRLMLFFNELCQRVLMKALKRFRYLSVAKLVSRDLTRRLFSKMGRKLDPYLLIRLYIGHSSCKSFTKYIKTMLNRVTIQELEGFRVFEFSSIITFLLVAPARHCTWLLEFCSEISATSLKHVHAFSLVVAIKGLRTVVIQHSVEGCNQHQHKPPLSHTPPAPKGK